MFICNCNALTDRHVKAAADDGATRWIDVHTYHDVQPQCGQCGIEIAEILSKKSSSKKASVPDIGLQAGSNPVKA